MTEIVHLADLRPAAESNAGTATPPDAMPDPSALTALRDGVLSIGNFDGVHLGHASLLAQTKRLAVQLDGPAIACLFDPHPIAILRPELAPKRLTSVEERAERMNRLGIDYLVVCRTSPDLLNLSAEAFLRALVTDRLQCRGLVEGANFCFGKDRRGDIDLLRDWCRQNHIEFTVAEMRSADGQMISSTRIRDLLQSGDVRTASAMMATPHRIEGTVAQGDRRGRLIGFPTANLTDIDVVIPAPGVYAGIATTNGVDWPAAIHIGESPTFGSGDASKVEVHLIGFAGDLYGASLSVAMIDRVRGAVRFDSTESMKNQLHRDIQSAQRTLDPYLTNRHQ